MRAVLLSDDHGGLDVTESLEAILEEEPDLVVHLGDMVPKQKEFEDDEDDEDYRNAVERAVEKHKDFDKRLVKEGIPFVKLPGNHDRNAFQELDMEEESYLGVLQNPSAFRYVEGLNTFESPTPHSLGFAVDPQRFLLVHGGLDGDTPYYDGECPENEVDMNVNFFYMGEYLSESADANLRGMSEYDVDVMMRGHDHRRQYEFRQGRGVLTTGSYDEGNMVLVDTHADGFRVRQV